MPNLLGPGGFRVGPGGDVVGPSAGSSTATASVATSASLARLVTAPPRAPRPQPQYLLRVRHPQTREILAITSRFTRLTYTRRRYLPGSFELEIGNEHVAAPALTTRNAIIELVVDGVTEFTGRVKRRRVEISDEGESAWVWTLGGFDMADLARKKLSLPAPTISDDDAATAGGDTNVQDNVLGSQALRYYVDSNLRSCAELTRRISYLQLGARARSGFDENRQRIVRLDQGAHIGGLIPHYATRWEPLTQVLANIAQASALGWEFRFDPDDLHVYFDVYEGADRTPGNTAGYAPMVFSLNHRNLKTATYEDDGADVENFVFVGGAGELTTRAIYWRSQGLDLPTTYVTFTQGERYSNPGLVSDWDRQEAFINYPQQLTADDITAAAAAYLAEHGDHQSLHFQLMDQSGAQYRRDWELGDRVTVSVAEIGIDRVDATINEVTVTLANDNEPTYDIVVGDPPIPPHLRYLRALEQNVWPLIHA